MAATKLFPPSEARFPPLWIMALMARPGTEE